MYTLHWILIIIGVSTALVVRSRLQKSDGVESVPVQPAHIASDTRFIAVLYPKISRHPKSDSMSKSLFAEHMTELRSASYCTVGLQQICDLYNANKLLPEKAVVILLDSHRDTCLNAAPVIEQLGLRATVMLNIGAMRQTSRSFMSWHDLRRMRWDPHWDFGITTRGSDELREQSEYLKRRFSDVRVCGVLGSVGKPHLASSGPFSAWLRPAASTIKPTSPASPSLPGGKIARSRANDGVFRQSLAPTDLGDSVTFSRDTTVFFPPAVGDGFNSSNTDPSCLSLLRLTPQQGAREFVRMLSSISSQMSRFEDRFTDQTRRLNWVSTCGDARVIDGMLELSCGPSRRSANAWSVGTYDWSDVDLAVEFKVTDGRQFWAYIRFSSEDSFIRLGCDGERLYLQQKVAGAKVQNLNVVAFDRGFSQFHALRLIVRGPYAIAYLDGQKLSSRPSRVDDSLVSGKVGLAIWDPSCGVASCRISRSSIRKLPCIALMNVDWYKGSAGWTTEHSDYLSYLCPDGLSVDASRVGGDEDDYNALLISSAYSGHTLAPTVVLEENDLKASDSDVLINKLANLVKNHRLEGIHLDCRKWQAGKSSVGLAVILEALKANAPESTLILSLSPQCYQTCEELLELADILVVGLEAQHGDLLSDIARRSRLKTLLRIESDEPWALAGGLESPANGQAPGDSTGDAGYVVQKYELKGIALCKR